jgi:hypothetical protein
MEYGFGARRKGVVRQSRQHLFETDAEPCQVGAEAPMHACSESEVSVALAIENAPIRVSELLRVTVRRGVVDQDRFAGAGSSVITRSRASCSAAYGVGLLEKCCQS